MCGIVGYVGREQAAPILLDGLSRLEYRGYDSAGVAVYHDGQVRVAKSKGRLQVLSDMIQGGRAIPGTIGIGHTRWATHGAPSDTNSHPHVSHSGKIAVVHNGIIENYAQLKSFLQAKGVPFVSETDSEVVAQLVEYFYEGDLLAAVGRVLHRIEGAYALGILCCDQPDQLIAVRKDSPLILGLGEESNFLASDVTAILRHTRDVIYMEDGEVAVLTAQGIQCYNSLLQPITKEVARVDWEVDAAEKGGYEHFMAKEIMEQPEALRRTIFPRIQDGEVYLEDFALTDEEIRDLQKLYIVACGSSYHVGMVGKYHLERLLRKPVEVALASEFRYMEPIVDEHTLMVVISQSGETLDTMAALREAKRLGAKVLAIVNVVGSSIARESDVVLYTWAGPEIAVATTKAYSTQLAVLNLLGLYFARRLGTIETEEYREAETLFVYVDCKHETETSDLIRRAWADGKSVAVPRVLGQEMKFFYIHSLETDLEDGYFGIREPYEKEPADEAADRPGSLMVMPGVAFDEARHRIGYGGGFYDRYLEAHPGLDTIALAFDFQVKEEVPFEPFDILPGKIVTEKRVIS